jgi:hypothetical protein
MRVAVVRRADGRLAFWTWTAAAERMVREVGAWADTAARRLAALDRLAKIADGETARAFLPRRGAYSPCSVVVKRPTAGGVRTFAFRSVDAAWKEVVQRVYGALVEMPEGERRERLGRLAKLAFGDGAQFGYEEYRVELVWEDADGVRLEEFASDWDLAQWLLERGHPGPAPVPVYGRMPAVDAMARESFPDARRVEVRRYPRELDS